MQNADESVFLCFATIKPDFLKNQAPTFFCPIQEKCSGNSFQETGVLAPINPALGAEI